MGSRTNRYRVDYGSGVPAGVCSKVMAIDNETGSRVLLKSGHGNDYGDTKWEYRTALLAQACNVPTVIGTWTRSELVDGYQVRPTYVLPWLDNAPAVEQNRNWSHRQQVDWLRIQAFAYIVGEGDRHAGNHLLTADRILGIDFAYPGYEQTHDINRIIRMMNPVVSDITKSDIDNIVRDLRAAKPAIEAYVKKMEREANRNAFVPVIRGWKGRLQGLKRELNGVVRDYR